MDGMGTIPAKASSGREVALELSYQWLSPEGPPLVDLYISRLGRRFWGESWHFLQDEAERLAVFLEEAAESLRRAEYRLVGEFIRAEVPSSRMTTPWLAVSVSPAPYLRAGAPRVRLAFEDEMTAETPDVASLWLTAAASQRLAQLLRQTSVRASGDEIARAEAREMVVQVDHACENLVPGHLLRVTGVGLRVHRICVYWMLTPQPPESELSGLLQSLFASASDNLGNEYLPGGSGYSAGGTAGDSEGRGLSSLKPGPHAQATRLIISLHAASQARAGERQETFEVDLPSAADREVLR